MSKVFGIGLNKTGTTTLGHCLQQLGYRHSSFRLDLLQATAAGHLQPLVEHIEHHDSFEDWPYPLVFRQLDVLFPGSRFILTRRPSPQRWLSSLEAHALRVDPEQGSRARTLAYGWAYPQLNRPAHLTIYANHLNAVRAHFRDRPDDLLEVCWEEEARWEPLCTFLGKPAREQPFPHANQAIAANPERLAQNLARLQALGGAP